MRASDLHERLEHLLTVIEPVRHQEDWREQVRDVLRNAIESAERSGLESALRMPADRAFFGGAR